MTGDRKLTKQEKEEFIDTKHQFKALQKIMTSSDEPSLFESAFIELAAKVKGQAEILIDVASDVQKLKDQAAEIEMIKHKLNSAIGAKDPER